MLLSGGRGDHRVLVNRAGGWEDGNIRGLLDKPVEEINIAL